MLKLFMVALPTIYKIKNELKHHLAVLSVSACAHLCVSSSGVRPCVPVHMYRPEENFGYPALSSRSLFLWGSVILKVKLG